MNNIQELKQKIASIPDRPGVYLMKDTEGRVIYIGKAASLKKRVGSYFSKQYGSAKQMALVEKIADIDYILTENEAEALILESALIKKNKPQYNVSLRDGKNYPLVKITSEDYPRLLVVRRRLDDGAVYFGPYTDAKLLRQAIKVLRRVFPYCTCRPFPKKPCLNYDIGLCPAPCIGEISKKEYAKNIEDIRLFLEGKNEELFAKLSKEMSGFSKERNFEKAKELRDKISALSSMSGAASIYEAESRELRRVLGLKDSPKRIEAFDISCISQEFVVGSMVGFLDGRPDKNNYRRFRIKGERLDDCASIAEVVRRRYKRVLLGEITSPDLILIDGGKGQLSAAKSELDNLRLRIPIISLAKKEEEIYLPQKDKPLRLAMDSKALTLIRRIRDEAHRFAVSYHRLLRKKKAIG
ncbi:MAG: excinuclease ABC subunit UvrC [Candidatus Omnitrophota bacterium]|nr:excinuclease ABC subunit UvrC [Candidatus Omnitrophota bacterium]